MNGVRNRPAIRSLQARRLTVMILLMVANASLVTATETWRWRDQNGDVHFGDTPPAGVAAERVEVQAPPSRLTPAEAQAEIDRLRGEREAAATAEAARARELARNWQRSLAAQAARRDRCERAKWALAALESGRPVYVDEQGMFRIKRPPGQGDAYEGARDYLDEARRAREIARQKRLFAKNCDGPPTAADRARTEDEIRTAEACEKAAADLDVMLAPQSGASEEEIAARRAFLSEHCGE